MGTLNKKILRDIWKNKAQFITIFIMTFLAIFAFAGIHGYMDGMKESARVYYEDQNLQDLWVTSKNITEEKLEEIKSLDNVKNAERMITINANVINSEIFITPLNNEKVSDLVLECNFIESNEINKMYLLEGEKFSKDKKGLWLDYYLAKNLGIKVGDELELSIEGINFKEKVVGLVETPDHVYFIKDDTAIFPTHSDYGFVYLSINEFPSDYIYDKILKTDEIQKAISDLKDLKKTLNDYGITNYNSIPSIITSKLGSMDKINLAKALELVDNYENKKQEFIQSIDKNFNIKDSYIYPYAIIDVENEDKINSVKTDLKENIEDIITVTAREDNISYSGYQREAEEGDTYSGVFSGLFVFIAILSVVTTMNRFVKKERTQIGTLKALGIKRYKITWMYVNYGLFIAIIAGILGIVLGNVLIGELFLKLEMEYYEIPYYNITVIPLVYYVTIGIIVAITFVTYLSCRKVLKQPAAEALRIDRPKIKVRKNGITTKKFFNKLSLSTKWNLRDIGRSKSRTLMALVGIAGCTMLVVTAFGMSDSITGYMNWEFGVINKFEYKLSLTADYTDTEYNELVKKYGSKTSQTVGVEFKNNDEIIVKPLTINDAEGLLEVTNHNKESFTMKDDGLYVTEKMASIYKLNIGDEIEWHIIGSDNWYKTKITGFNKDPQSQQFNCTKTFYNTLNEEYKPDSIYTNEDLNNIKEIPGVNTIQTIQNLKDGINSMLGMMYTLIGLLIVVSSILAVVIIYNLGILSFSEKEYQFATLKVLGFKYKSIKRIFIKQNIWISIVAILIALPLGYYITDFIFINAIGDTYDFNAVISLQTYIISGIGTFIVTYIVNQFLARKIKKIDMVSSLKGNE